MFTCICCWPLRRPAKDFDLCNGLELFLLSRYQMILHRIRIWCYERVRLTPFKGYFWHLGNSWNVERPNVASASVNQSHFMRHLIDKAALLYKYDYPSYVHNIATRSRRSAHLSILMHHSMLQAPCINLIYNNCTSWRRKRIWRQGCRNRHRMNDEKARM